MDILSQQQTLFTVGKVPIKLSNSQVQSICTQTKPLVVSAQKCPPASQMDFGQPVQRSQVQTTMSMVPPAAASLDMPSGGAVVTKSFKNLVNAAPARRVSVAKMLMSSGNKASKTMGNVNGNMGGIASQSKMRFDRSQVGMSATKGDDNEFKVSTSSGQMSMKANFMDDVMNKKQKIGSVVGAVAVSLALFSADPAYAIDVGAGKQVFEGNCAACHAGGQNVIQSEKTLEKAALEEYLDGGFNEKAIKYQVVNGKNSMPAWGGRLSDDEISNVTAYVFKTATDGTWDQ